MTAARFILGDGTSVPEGETDQAGSALEVRTLRGRFCVLDQVPDAALMAAELDRRRSPPRDKWLMPDEFDALIRQRPPSPEFREALRLILVVGWPIEDAIQEAYPWMPPARFRNLRRRLQRRLREMGF